MVGARNAHYKTLTTSEIFVQKEINDKMSPVGIEIRESRDSDEHPSSFPIILGLDVTGSMGSIPNYLIREGLPALMDKIVNECGVKDPQLLFVGIGDSHYDRSPLQVGQFESSGKLMDYWLENIYLEGGGGGNSGEDYLLCHQFANDHVVTDHWDKRQKKGIIITIGDERYLRIETALLNEVYNKPMQPPSTSDLIKNVKEKWDVFHIHTNNRDYQSGVNVANEWRKLLGDDNVIVENDKEKIVDAIVNAVSSSLKIESGNTDSASQVTQKYNDDGVEPIKML